MGQTQSVKDVEDKVKADVDREKHEADKLKADVDHKAVAKAHEVARKAVAKAHEAVQAAEAHDQAAHEASVPSGCRLDDNVVGRLKCDGAATTVANNQARINFLESELLEEHQHKEKIEAYKAELLRRDDNARKLKAYKATLLADPDNARKIATYKAELLKHAYTHLPPGCQQTTDGGYGVRCSGILDKHKRLHLRIYQMHRHLDMLESKLTPPPRTPHSEADHVLVRLHGHHVHRDMMEEIP